MNSVFRQVGGIIVTLNLSSHDLNLDMYCMICSYKSVCKQEAASTTCHPVVLAQRQQSRYLAGVFVILKLSFTVFYVLQ